MSIRFRLTLLYSVILALMLTIFSVVLYSIQAQNTLNSLKQDLIQSNEKMTEALLRTDSASFQQPPNHNYPPPPREFDEFSGEQAFKDLREREIVRVLDQNGNLIASPAGRIEDALPLSDEGLVALQAQQVLWEEGIFREKEMLIYNRPIVQDGNTIFIVQTARPLTERNRTLASLATTLGGASIITILIAFGVGWVLSGVTLRPIHRITKTAQTIGDERDFTRRVDYKGPEDEVGRLANTFNQMLSRLQDAYQKVEHSLEMQRDFVADVSHELRTPLTTLLGNLGLLRHKSSIPSEEQDDILLDMVDESDRLIRLVNDLLILARADAGRSLMKETIAIQPVLEETIRQAHQLDTQRVINLTISDECTMLGDRDALKQVMLILLDNALKHSNGEIEITVYHEDAQVKIQVEDHGDGMSSEQIAHIFDRFYRGDESTITPGFGLGLPIAKALIEGMDGEITFTSETGKGSTVMLHFLCKSCL